MNVNFVGVIAYNFLVDMRRLSRGGVFMFINKWIDGENNICGKAVARCRKNMDISQRQLADNLQLLGLDVDKNAVQRIEAGKRFVTDIELVYLSKALKVTVDELLGI